MATWTNVPNSSIETDKPVRAVDIRALRDNPVAIAEGAAGAPRIDPIDAILGAGVVGGIGTYSLMLYVPEETIDVGETTAGSNLLHSSTTQASSFTPPGTWRTMGGVFFTAPENRISFWVRIA